LVVGVAAASATPHNVLLTGVAGLVAGAMSMATGEYVSVSSQADSEQADLAREQEELRTDPIAEQQELADIYVARGLAPALALQVAQQLMAHDALGTHAREELGISEAITTNPVQAALASAASFMVGAALPLAVILLAPAAGLAWTVSVTALLFLAALGALAAYVGGSGMLRAAARVTFWGALAMGLTAAVGHFFSATP
jgi:VIT1/CCC1 family predicted Fe2+/Mn2+ transporter